MRTLPFRTTRCVMASLALVFAFASYATAGATITIVNMDGPNEGFNDPTIVAPVGGNPGTTVGQQRLIAAQFAASIWGAALDSPVEIRIQATFDPLICTATSATLGASSAIQIFANFPGREFNNIWYHVALANKLAGIDLAPPSQPFSDDVVTFFNSSLTGNPACLAGRRWYYGLDGNHGSDIDLVTVMLHEYGHGLGFSSFINVSNGGKPLGLSDVYSIYSRDVATGKSRAQMTTTELVASAINTNKLVWDGINVNADAGFLAPGTPGVTIAAPSTLGLLRVGQAQFGPALSSPGVTGSIVQALDDADAAGPTTFDGCSPLTNAGAIGGAIALIDRGTCGFAIKTKNAQNAGATAVIIANNAVGSPPAGLAGVDPTITIPTVLISQADANAIKAALAGGSLTGTVGINLAVRQGTEFFTGKVLLNAPNPVQPGSSVSHFDPIASPNLLMEPATNADLTHGLDLTLSEMRDIGWFSDGDGVPDGIDVCPGSDPSATVVIGGNDSGVPNTVFANGCKISDYVESCADNATNHGKFASCVADLGNQLTAASIISEAQKDALQSAAARARIP